MGLKPHQPSDYPSFLLYVLDETHLTVTVLTASWILYTRSSHSAYFALGALASSFAAKLTKKLIRSPRPPPPPPSTTTTETHAKKTHIRPKKTYGMPSTHSTALTFYCAYLVPALLFSTTQAPPSPLLSNGTTWFRSFSGNIAAAVAISTYWAGGIWSRVELGYHTYPQCLGGMALGTVMAVVWRGIWEKNGWIEGNLQGLMDSVWRVTLARLGL